MANESHQSTTVENLQTKDGIELAYQYLNW